MSALFDGPDVTPADEARLQTQLQKVEAYMRDGRWRSLRQISEAAGGSEASASARLRDLRKPRFGGYIVERRRTFTEGVWEYRLLLQTRVGTTFPRRTERAVQSKAAERIRELEDALRKCEAAMCKNIAYATRKDEGALKEGIEAARAALRGSK